MTALGSEGEAAAPLQPEQVGQEGLPPGILSPRAASGGPWYDSESSPCAPMTGFRRLRSHTLCRARVSTHRKQFSRAWSSSIVSHFREKFDADPDLNDWPLKARPEFDNPF